LVNIGFQTVYNNTGIGLEPKHTAWSYALIIWNLGKWNSVKWNEARRIGAIFASFWVAQVCQRQLGFLVYINVTINARSYQPFTVRGARNVPYSIIRALSYTVVACKKYPICTESNTDRLVPD